MSTVARALTFPRTREAMTRRFRIGAVQWWIAAAFAWMVFGFARGFMDDLGFARHGSGIDTELFGGLPSLWLQRHLYDVAPRVLSWASLLTHASWFVIPWIAAGIVSWRRPQRTGSFFRWWIALMAFALPIFAVFPVAPPWLAHDGVLRVNSLALHRPVEDNNPFAALPSMHVALPFVSALWFMRERWTKPAMLMFGYAGIIAFEVVFSGEHYVVDAVAAVAVASAVAAAAVAASRIRFPSLTSRQTRRQPALAPRVAMEARGQRGQNLLEFALLSPFVVVFIGGIVIFGLAMNTRASLQQAVREGARQISVGRTLAEAQNIAAGNAPDVLHPADIRVCYPMNGTSQGQVGDPVRVYIYRSGAEGYPFTIAPTSGVLNAIGIRNLVVRMSPRATARLEKSVSSPNSCPP